MEYTVKKAYFEALLDDTGDIIVTQSMNEELGGMSEFIRGNDYLCKVAVSFVPIYEQPCKSVASYMESQTPLDSGPHSALNRIVSRFKNEPFFKSLAAEELVVEVVLIATTLSGHPIFIDEKDDVHASNNEEEWADFLPGITKEEIINENINDTIIYMEEE